MAIIIENKSKCPLCKGVLTNQEEYILTPPLISNINDALFKVSDSGIHKSCLNQSTIKEKLLKCLSIYYKRPALSELRCSVDNLVISNPEKIIMIGLLTSNEYEELYKFNYITLNRDNICKWEQKNDFIEAAEKFNWIPFAGYNYLKYILNQVKGNC